MHRSQSTMAGVALGAALASLAAAEPPMAPVTALPGDATPGPAAGDQTAPAAALGDGTTLVIWVDESSAWGGPQSEADLVGLRLAADGTPVDPTPFVISREAGHQRAPQVAWNGSHWLVAWENQTPTEFYYQTEIFAARVAPDGVVLDAESPIRPFAGDAGDAFALASNGSEWLVVTQSHAAGEGGIRGRRIAADGSLPDATPTLLVPPSSFLYFNLDLDAAGGEYLLSFSGSGDFEARRFAADLAPLGAPIPLPPVRRLAGGGSGYYLVFAGGPFNGQVLGSPLDPDGTLAIPGGVQLDDGTGAWLETQVAFDGTTWWVSRLDALSGLTFQRVTGDGTLLDPVGFAIDPAHENDQGGPAIAARPGGGVTAVWADRRAGGLRPYDVYAAAVIDPASFETGAAISLAAPLQAEVEIADGPDQHLVLWTSRVSGASRVLALRCDPTGLPLDAEPIVVDAGADASAPSAAWNGAHYLVTWNRGGEVLARRLDAGGGFPDPAPVTVMTGGAPDVAALGPNFLVAATDVFNFPHYRATYVRRIDGTNAQPIDPDRFIVSYGNFAQLARVETFGARWLVTWQDNFSHDNPQSAVYARFVDAAGGQSEQLTAIYSTGGTPDLAVSGDTALFVWRNNALANANNFVAGRRLLPDGTWADASPFVIAEAPGRQMRPVVTWDGEQFAAAWEDQRARTSFFDDRAAIFGARLAASGPPVLDPDGYAVFDDAPAAALPAIASTGDGTCVAAASLLEDEPGLGTYRIRLRRIGAASAPAADVTNDGIVNVDDLVAVISAWGACAGCPEDVDGDGDVDVDDLVLVISGWS